MSDFFMMLVDADVSLEHADELCRSVITEFANRHIITGELTPDYGLGSAGYLPGPALQDLYEPSEMEHPFWSVLNSGVEPQVERTFNHWALGPSCLGFTCPKCKAEFEPEDKKFFAALTDAIGEWLKESGPANLNCPHCGKGTIVTEWGAKPPIGFGNLSFRFWNWPPFDSPGWKLDIPSLVRDITQHTIVTTHGHI